MNTFLFILLLSLATVSVASEVLYSHEDASLKILKTEEIASIKVDGDYLSFNLNSDRLFLLTAFAMKQGSPKGYPNAAGLNEAIYRSKIGEKKQFKLADKADLHLNFNNKKILGSMYMTHYFGSTRMLCEMNFIHPVGNHYYWMMTLTTSSEECEDQQESLMKSIRNVYKSISVNGI